MPLSRHFYSLDEVQSALRYTTTRNDYSEAIFWCKEMILSGSISETISTLFESWLWNKGPFCLQWLINAWTTLSSSELSENDILLSTYQLTSIHHTQRDNSLWNILVLSTKPVIPDRVTTKTPSILPSDDNKEIYFIRAMYQGKARSAWWISFYLNNNRIWELLEWYSKNIHSSYYDQYAICLQALQNYHELLGYKSNEYDTITRCLAILSLCISPHQQHQSFKPLPSTINPIYLETINKYQIGTKDRRIYSIPTLCLYGTTIRGTYEWSKNNHIQLNNIEKNLIGCPYWDEILTEYATVNQKGIIWNSDDKMEEFYNIYFPDDIPDEWSKNEKNKSHGDGILGPNEEINIIKYSKIYFSKQSKLAWNTLHTVNKYLEEYHITSCDPSIIITFIPLYESFNQDILKPVHKHNII